MIRHRFAVHQPRKVLRRPSPFRPVVEELESRCLLATFTVNTLSANGDANLGDGLCSDFDGLCDLAGAIQEANASPGLDTIEFNIPGPGVQRLVFFGEPEIRAPVIIDGYTQPGSRPNTSARWGRRS